jgi:hypothetical protein
LQASSVQGRKDWGEKIRPKNQLEARDFAKLEAYRPPETQQGQLLLFPYY